MLRDKRDVTVGNVMKYLRRVLGHPDHYPRELNALADADT